MKNIIVFILSLISIAIFSGCASTDPHAHKISYEGTFGESKVEFEAMQPKDMKGKALYLSVHKVDDDLKNTLADAGNIANPNVVDSGPTESSGDRTPVLDKEFVGVEYTIIDYEEANNPEVIAAIAELNKAISENNTDAIKNATDKLTDLLGTTVTKLIKP